MIVNPFREKERLTTYAGTRILQNDFGLVGTSIRDPHTSDRTWCIQSLYAPLRDSGVGGIRAKLVDNKEFATFINQMDLEVLLGLGTPGNRCRWSQRDYNGLGERYFYGFCIDDEDLIDDLYDRELLLRGQINDGLLFEGLEITRRLHIDESSDVEELYVLLWDGDKETGITPDLRLETIDRRWARVERIRSPWIDTF